VSDINPVKKSALEVNMSFRNPRKRFLSACLLASIFMVQALFAQGSGTIKGRVTDQATGDALPGAIVVVVNTSIGASTDLDGQFTLRLVPAGKQTLKASYIGYDAITREVTVTANATLEQEFQLSPHAILGKEVVVTAQARGQQSAINQQLAANSILNVVSEQRIQELPDFNAAQALARLPGIATLYSSGEANKVVIRGLAPKYNEITIGGISLASTGSTQIGVTSQDIAGSPQTLSNDRSVDLSLISPYMIKTIEVYKALTPDLNADAIGGVVNFELREAPPEFHTDLLWQSGYTQKSDKYGNYRTVGSASTRFFNDLLGVYVLGNAESYDRNADNMSAGYEITSNTLGTNGYLPVRVTNVQLDRHIETRKRYGANLILDYRLPSGSIKLVNLFSRLASDYQDYRTVYNYSAPTQDLIFRYQEGDNNVDLMTNSLGFTYDLGFMSVDLTAANKYSRNNLPAAPQSEFVQTRGVGVSTPNTTPEDLTYLITYGGTDNAFLNTLTRFSSDYKENGQVYKGDFKVPFNLASTFTGFFKFGGQFNYTQDKNAQNTPYATIGGTTGVNQLISAGMIQQFGTLDYNSALARFPSTAFTSNNGDLLKSFLDDRFGSMIWVNDASLLTSIIDFVAANPAFSSYNSTAVQPGGWFDGLFQTLPNSYTYIERYYAGYLMSELNYGDLMIVGGARYEKVKTLYEAYNLKDGRDVKSQQADTVTVYPGNEFWLPMVQARFKATDWFDVRAAYTQSLARPDYQQLSPHFTIGYGLGSVRAGNPDLRPAHAYNGDLVFTFHSNDLGLFSIGGFYKEIKDFTYSTQYPLYAAGPPGIKTISDFNILGSSPISGATLYTYINTPYLAYVRGVEMDLQTRFWYLPAPFNGIVLGINYSRISSTATYPWRNARTTIIGPRQTVTQVFDSTRTGRLIDQPNNVANAYIGYDYEGFSARLSFLFQGNAVSNVGNFPEQDGFTTDYFRMDASVRQVLPWYGIELYLDMNNLNSRNNISAQQSIDGFTSQQNYGLTASLGLRYRL
jgi:TonB-dependent receptor